MLSLGLNISSVALRSAVDPIISIVESASGDRGYWPTSDAGLAKMGQVYNGSLGDVGDGDVIGQIQPSAGNIPLLQTVSGDRATWSGANKAFYTNGTNTFLKGTESAGWGTDMTLALAWKSSDTNSVLLASNAAGSWALVAESASASTGLWNIVGTPSLRVDGAAFAGSTRDDLFNALNDGAYHIIYFSGINLSDATWDSILFGFYSSAPSASPNAYYGSPLIMPTPSTGDRDIIEAALAAKYGVTLP